MNSPCWEGHRKSYFWSFHSTWHLHRPLCPPGGQREAPMPHILPGGAPRAACGTDGLLLLWRPIPPQHPVESRPALRRPLGRVTPYTGVTCSSEHIQLAGDVPVALPQPRAAPTAQAPSLPHPVCCLHIICPAAHFSSPAWSWGLPCSWPCCRDPSLAAHSPGAGPCPRTSQGGRAVGLEAEISSFSPVRFSSCQTPPVSPPPDPTAHTGPYPTSPPHTSPRNCLPGVFLLNPSNCIPQTSSNPLLVLVAPSPSGKVFRARHCSAPQACRGSALLEILLGFLGLLVPHRNAKAGSEQNTSSTSSGQPVALLSSAPPLQ